MAKPKTLAYLDTDALLTIIGYEPVDEGIRKIIQRVKYDHVIKIPQIVLGEALSVILKDSKNVTKIEEYIEVIRQSHKTLNFASDRFPPTNNKVVDMAQELRNTSSVINNMDSLILAHAIVDDDAVKLYTGDVAMRNDRIVKYIDGLVKSKKRKNGLVISAELNEYLD